MPAHIGGVGGVPKTSPLAQRRDRRREVEQAGHAGRLAVAHQQVQDRVGADRAEHARGRASASAICQFQRDREAFDRDAERQHHRRGRREVDADRRAQVDCRRRTGAGTACRRSRRASAQTTASEAGARRRAGVDACADDQRDAGEADADAELLRGAEPLVQPARHDHRREQRLQREDQRRHAGRQAPALRVVAAAEVAGVAEQAGDGDVAPLARASSASARAGRRRASATTKAMRVADADVGERRRVLRARCAWRRSRRPRSSTK